MKILTRYVIRTHVGPFVFAFTAVTGLLFLNAIAQRLENLAGRGLDLNVIGEFMVLSLPHIIALTFPMAILVAVLYAFSEMTGNNEVAAMAAGGIHPIRLIKPLLVVGVALSGLMFLFNDRVLPESNHRLSTLMQDIAGTSPTLELREGIVNEIHTSDGTRYFLQPRSIDRETSRLDDVRIWDMSEPTETRTIVAKHGHMAFSPDGQDLFLTLEDGVIYESSDERPGNFQRLDYETQILPLRGVMQELQRRTEGARSKREMSVAMLQGRVAESERRMRGIGEESVRVSIELLDATLEGRPPLPEGVGYDWDELGRELRVDQDLDQTREELELVLGLEPGTDRLLTSVAGTHRTNLIRWDSQRRSAYSYSVEVHKKFAIAFACLIFVLLGPPLAIRFPQGGVGMVIAASVGIFFFYWMGLIGGERLAERGQMHPVVAMWTPNLILLIPALVLMAGMGRQISTNRGSTWDAMRARLATLADRARGRPGPLAELPEAESR